MADSGRIVLVRAVTAALRDIVVESLRGRGAEPHLARTLTGAVERQSFSAAFLELGPDDKELVEHLPAFSAVHLSAVIGLYVTPRTGVEPLLSRAIRTTGLSFLLAQTSLGEGNEEQRVTEFLGGLLQVAPITHAAFTMRQAMGTVPPIVAEFIDRAGEYVSAHTHANVKTVASRLTRGPRSLQRACDAAGVPSPKRLLDWFVLLTTLQVASDLSLSHPDAAQRAGVTLTHFDQARATLLPHSPASWEPRSELDVAIAAFRSECRARRAARAHGAGAA